MTNSISRLIEFNNLNNTRDLGGMTGYGGRKIKAGKLLRSGQLFPASDEDKEKLGSMVDMFVDFRTSQECTEKPDPSVLGIEYLHLPAFGDLVEGVTREEKTDRSLFKAMGADPQISMEHMCRVYAGFIQNQSCISCYRTFLDILLKEREKAVLWHCTAGKDRTGFAALLIQEILGVEKEDIVRDYLKTNENLSDEIKGIIKMIRSKQEDFDEKNEEALKVLFGARTEFLDALYGKADELYGSFSGFLKDGLKVTEEEIEKLREM
ncbi:MAG: tyrosine-protein phosphatase [Firmicutes bacterium]|nr:tyrosine-protein phosphatase [Bacillota bacterium]